MPTYSYRCTECDTAFDIHQAFSENSLTQCPSCAGKLRKVFSSIGVTFNGSGFYRNDSRATTKTSDKASAAPAAASGSGSEGSSGSSGSAAPAKSESKPKAAAPARTGAAAPAAS